MIFLRKNLPPNVAAVCTSALMLLTLLSTQACQRGALLTQPSTADVATGYEILGELTGAPAGSKLYLMDAQNVRLDSAILDAAGRFRLGGKIATPTVYLLAVKGAAEPLPVYLDNYSALQLTADASNLLGSAQVSGSANAQVLQILVAAQARRRARIAELIRQLDWTPALWEAANGELTATTIQLVRQHSASAVAPYAVLSLVGEAQQVAFVDSLTTRFAQTQPESPYTQALLAHRQALAATALGQVAPEVVLPGPDGRPVALSSLRGRYVLIDFWASWCKPCRVENPHLVQLYEQYKGKGFEVYGVSLDGSREKWLKAVAADKLPWVQVSDLQGFKGKAVAAYAAQAIPLTLLLDPQGRIIAKSPTGEELQEKLAALLP